MSKRFTEPVVEEALRVLLRGNPALVRPVELVVHEAHGADPALLVPVDLDGGHEEADGQALL